MSSYEIDYSLPVSKTSTLFPLSQHPFFYTFLKLFAEREDDILSYQLHKSEFNRPDSCMCSAR